MLANRRWSTLQLTDAAVALQTLVKHVSRLEREKETAAAQRKEDEQQAAEARSRARKVVHTPQTGVSSQLAGKANDWQEDAVAQGPHFRCTGTHSLCVPVRAPACSATLLTHAVPQDSLCGLSQSALGSCRCRSLSGPQRPPAQALAPKAVSDLLCRAWLPAKAKCHLTRL